MGLTEFETILCDAVKNLEKLTGVKIAKQKIDQAMKEAIHISIHELAHMYLEQALPWLSNLEENSHTFVDEILARFLERRVSTELHLFIESFEEQLKELKMYSSLRELDWTEDFYSRLYDDFEKHISHGGALETFARKILEYY